MVTVITSMFIYQYLPIGWQASVPSRIQHTLKLFKTTPTGHALLSNELFIAFMPNHNSLLRTDDSSETFHELNRQALLGRDQGIWNKLMPIKKLELSRKANSCFIRWWYRYNMGYLRGNWCASLQVFMFGKKKTKRRQKLTKFHFASMGRN